ncbi:MAG: 2-amino-4-hydroxy-6-hydroxymethyldihydropteridine diphosphokinase [Deltaproteobacteria bacterium]|nr:2-amino-4-hydroxy-6-hydroxymethyldihydropteridine diphosphokinase [Deltaproteobacteria bacterium]
MSEVAYIAIGSNEGDALKNCKRAIEKLNNTDDIKVTKVSSFYKTEPWGVTEQEEFINSAARIETTLTPEDLLEVCRSIEESLGRARQVKWGPRIIDLDIIFFGDRVISGSDLKVPHPHLKERAFVLKPLMDIAPEKIHPVTGATVTQMAEAIGDEGIIGKAE